MTTSARLDRYSLKTGMLPTGDNSPVIWEISDTPVAYDDAVERMERIAGEIRRGEATERVWLVEHPALYTAGTSAKPSDLLRAEFPVFKTGRGGEYTYHGPGQRVCYVMLDLNRRDPDVRSFVATLERWIIDTLASFNIRGETREDRVGVWVSRPEKPKLPDGSTREDKIAAIGIRLRKWVTFHGIAINLEPELDHYDGIVPCGVKGHGVTSFADLGITATINDLDLALKASFEPLFGPVVEESKLHSQANGL